MFIAPKKPANVLTGEEREGERGREREEEEARAHGGGGGGEGGGGGARLTDQPLRCRSGELWKEGMAGVIKNTDDSS